MMPKGMPGLRGTEHIGFTVPNLSEATAFFEDVIGCEVFYYTGPESDRAGTRMRDRLNVDKQAVIQKCCLIRCGNGVNLEVFEWEAADQNHSHPRNSDIGGHHLAFYVDDIHSAAESLRSKGVQLLGEPEFVAHGPNAGEWWVYFLAPWGMQMELLSYPNGRAYERNREGKLWHPAP